ncbi:MAG: von Willebrand factor type domain protein [Gammaproteobacteria bacterium]|jgi:mxaC protein|nr:von Willebrand factor type domain protein [Gammaproteobacteria bacterium]
MSINLDFSHPWALLLLPLAALPLLWARSDTLLFSYLPWLPADPAGRIVGWLRSAFAVLAIASIVAGLAGPGRPQTQVARTGRGAEIVVLIDRSRSMDERMLPSNWRTIDPIVRTQQAWNRGPQKSKTARDLLSKFVAQRADDRFALMFFSAGPLPVVNFTQHDDVVLAGITAGGTGPGLSSTDVGRALIAAIAEFDLREYSGSRIVLLVSDGGAQLDPPTRKRIAAGLARNRIALYWLYLRSINSPSLDSQDPQSDAVAEIAMHHFFQSLSTPYHAYQAAEPKDLAQAVADVGRQQNLPLDYLERIPRRDYDRLCFGLGAFSCVMLLSFGAVQLRGWS